MGVNVHVGTKFTWKQHVITYFLHLDRFKTSFYLHYIIMVKGRLKHVTQNIFTSRSARSARTAGSKDCFTFTAFVRTYHVHNVIRYYATAVCSSFGGLQAKLQQVKAVVCCQGAENLVGSRKDPAFVAYNY